MDPDAALLELRMLVAMTKAHKRMSTAQVVRLTRLVDDLDGWLTTGGQLPNPWRHGQSAAEVGGE